MSRLSDGIALNQTSFVEEWVKLSGVNSLLACAERSGVRIGIWGGVVRNFILDERPIITDGQSAHFIDFVDPYSDIDCVLDRADDWYLVAHSISSSVAFSGYHRWEVQTLDRIVSIMNDYVRIAAESLIVWHEGFHDDGKPRISLQALEDTASVLLKSPARRMGLRDETRGIDSANPWQNVFDSLRLSRYFLQYGSALQGTERPLLPDERGIGKLLEASGTEAGRGRNWLRFNLAVLDIVMTAASLPRATEYLHDLHRTLPSLIRERSNILESFLSRYQTGLSFVGGLVYHQRDSEGLRIRLLAEKEGNLSRNGLRSVVPWTFIWSLGTGADDCCRHQDFKNGVAVISWRPVSPDTAFNQRQVFDYAPVAQIARDTPYETPPIELLDRSRGAMSIPGIVRVGPSLTLRFDHAYIAQFLGHNVQTLVGLVDPESIQ